MIVWWNATCLGCCSCCNFHFIIERFVFCYRSLEWKCDVCHSCNAAALLESSGELVHLRVSSLKVHCLLWIKILYCFQRTHSLQRKRRKKQKNWQLRSVSRWKQNHTIGFHRRGILYFQHQNSPAFYPPTATNPTSWLLPNPAARDHPMTMSFWCPVAKPMDLLVTSHPYYKSQ